MRSRTGGAWRMCGVGAVVAVASVGFASGAGAQQARALVSPFLHLPDGVRLAEIEPRTLGARAREVEALEAFTLPDLDRHTIYINVDRSLWRLACADREEARFYRAMLASIIAHELLHLRGERSEVAALSEERRVWIRFVRDRLVPRDLGLQRASLLDREISNARLRSSGHHRASARQAVSREPSAYAP